jgi:tetratricopeptide (TPR) repeat protein
MSAACVENVAVEERTSALALRGRRTMFVQLRRHVHRAVRCLKIRRMYRSLFLAILVTGCAASSPPPPIAPAAAAEPAARLRVVPLTTSSDVARAAYLRGRRWLQRGAQAKANEEYRAAVAADPNFAQAHTRVGTTSMGDERERALARAEELATNLPPAERALIKAYVVGSRTPRTFSAQLRRVLELAPDDWEVHYTLAQSLQFLDGDLAAARVAYQRASQLAPDEPGPHGGLAMLLSRIGEHEAASASATRQAALLPDDVRALGIQADVLFRAGKLDDAERAYRAAGRLEGHAADEDVALVKAYRGDVMGAIEDLERSLAAPIAERMRGTQEGFFARFQVARSLAWLYVLGGRAVRIEPMLAAVERELVAGQAHGLALGTLRLRAEVLIESGRRREAAAVLETALARARASADPAPLPARTRSLRITQLDLAVTSRDAATVDRLAAELLAEDARDLGAARVRVLTALYHGDAAAILAELPTLRADEERFAEAKLAASAALAESGREDEAARLRSEVAGMFVPSGRIVLLRHRVDPS